MGQVSKLPVIYKNLGKVEILTDFTLKKWKF